METLYECVAARHSACRAGGGADLDDLDNEQFRGDFPADTGWAIERNHDLSDVVLFQPAKPADRRGRGGRGGAAAGVRCAGICGCRAAATGRVGLLCFIACLSLKKY